MECGEIMTKSREHMENALYHLKEKIKTANSREMVEQIVDSMIDIYLTLYQTKD